jgi:NTP pyrophosphatase (non-canonical NTP hydrolase)
MEFSTYQEEAHALAMYPKEHALTYTALGLAGEAGEVANKMKKILRDADDSEAGRAKRAELLSQIGAELGDVLWYVAELATVLGVSLDDIARENLDKLNNRKVRGVLGGSGDTR